MTIVESAAPVAETEQSRVKRLKAATRGAHGDLDSFIMASKPFESRENFGKFVETQYLFHRDLDVFFANATLDGLLPDLKGRRRLSMIEQDLSDLGLAIPETAAPRFSAETPFDLPEAMGWLYVVEGSNLGAAFLLKDAAKLGLGEEFGARHLAGAPEGRGLHWRTFTAALDEISLTVEEEERVVAGAESAFRAVHAYAQQRMG
ncbi:biliverdin-producing heme oxygenase [Agrobacterium salinitolerans]|uniref:Biliverdin-producing heme oxygenase n=1 Tax=Agrobacterium salinitolerans TaxID=1183413 RepID=A0ABY3BLA9_9HYPH|nr:MULTISPECIES: biliverdin-producing heme oxygenase [Agrobacterium]MCZ7893793.1 biliverdin-producing heme oxygenase [Agrobacterium salinitolerans]OOO28662.1 biliverdin-producing heme oxygenase [Agrobacterium salinitolerans]PNQ26230.1 biliverdin-producing heme oxygenase [Rhizobium sp. YIC5082]TRA86912.1 biliverdin-producing heme oxygenase [Agrobacterium salinitolerans]